MKDWNLLILIKKKNIISSYLDDDKSNASFKTQKSIGKDSFNKLTKDVEEESNNVLITQTTKKVSNAHCQACGNCFDKCHNELFGEFLVQEAISLYENLLIKIVLQRMTFAAYSNQNTIAIYVFSVVMIMINTIPNNWYELHVCIESGSLLSAIHVIGQQQQYNLYSKKRKYGAIRNNMGGC